MHGIGEDDQLALGDSQSLPNNPRHTGARSASVIAQPSADGKPMSNPVRRLAETTVTSARLAQTIWFIVWGGTVVAFAVF